MNDNRRPLKIREHELAKKVTRWLSTKAITPNQISVCSFFCRNSGNLFIGTANRDRNRPLDIVLDSR
jgi:hypothetical protein